MKMALNSLRISPSFVSLVVSEASGERSGATGSLMGVIITPVNAFSLVQVRLSGGKRTVSRCAKIVCTHSVSRGLKVFAVSWLAKKPSSSAATALGTSSCKNGVLPSALLGSSLITDVESGCEDIVLLAKVSESLKVLCHKDTQWLWFFKRYCVTQAMRHKSKVRAQKG